jgi:hypothetical protein
MVRDFSRKLANSITIRLIQVSQSTLDLSENVRTCLDFRFDGVRVRPNSNSVHILTEVSTGCQCVWGQH